MKKTMFTMAVLLLGTAFAMAEAINITKTGASGIPFGWEPYGHGGGCRNDAGALRITTSVPESEWGIKKVIPVKGNGKYTFSLEVAHPQNAVVGGSFRLMLVAGSQQGSIASFSAAPSGNFVKISSSLIVFDSNVKSMTVYIFSAKKETGDYLVRNAVLTRSVK